MTGAADEMLVLRLRDMAQGLGGVWRTYREGTGRGVGENDFWVGRILKIGECV